MSVTFLVQTQFGPYQTGSTLKVSSDYAQRLVQQYGNDVTITPRFSGTYWYGDGAILTVTPLISPGIIYVNFQSTVEDPGNPNPQFRIFYAGRTYQFTVTGLNNLTKRNPNVVISYDRNGNRVVPKYAYQSLADQGTTVFAREYGTSVEPGIVYRSQMQTNGSVNASNGQNATQLLGGVKTYRL